MNEMSVMLDREALRTGLEGFSKNSRSGCCGAETGPLEAGIFFAQRLESQVTVVLVGAPFFSFFFFFFFFFNGRICSIWKFLG